MRIKQLIVVVGPTGSGKTDLSIRLARHYGAPILSTDSRQFYRGLAIGTAQPTATRSCRRPNTTSSPRTRSTTTSTAAVTRCRLSPASNGSTHGTTG